MGEMYNPPVVASFDTHPLVYSHENGSVYVFTGRAFQPAFALALRRMSLDGDARDSLVDRLSEDVTVELIDRFDEQADRFDDRLLLRVRDLIEDGAIRVYRFDHSELDRLLEPEETLWGGPRRVGACVIELDATRETLNNSEAFRTLSAAEQQRIVANVNEVQNLGYPEVELDSESRGENVAEPIGRVEAFLTFNPAGQFLQGLGNVPGNLAEGAEQFALMGYDALRAPMFYIVNTATGNDFHYRPESGAGQIIDHYGWGEGSLRLTGHAVHGLMSPLKAFYQGDPEGTAEGLGEMAAGFGVGRVLTSSTLAAPNRIRSTPEALEWGSRDVRHPGVRSDGGRGPDQRGRSRSEDSDGETLDSREALLEELREQEVSHNANDIIDIRRDEAGNIFFLERGNSNAGFEHILERHRDDFENKGVNADEIKNLIMNAVEKGDKVGHQGSGYGRPIYRVVHKEETHYVAVTVADNGFIVGANPSSKP